MRRSYMHEKIESNNLGELCETLFSPGIFTSQTLILKYTATRKVCATTRELMWSTGCKLPSLDVIYKPHIGVEVEDIKLNVFNSYFSYLNPINIIGSALTWGANLYYGVHFSTPIPPNNKTVSYHVPNIFKMSVGQEGDMTNHRENYDSWKAKEDRTDGLILWGVSRGTATTFCAYEREKYPEVKLVVLEGAIDSVQNLLPKYVAKVLPIDVIAKGVTSTINAGLSFFKKIGITQYDPEGPSPLKSVAGFPERTPVVFITSKMDKVVHCENTENIAKALADRGLNDVYLLKLEKSSHPNYMFDNIDDHNNYETFIHAVYKKYNLRHDSELAKAGAHLLDKCLLHKVETPTLSMM
jgi:hypothetical protein